MVRMDADWKAASFVEMVFAGRPIDLRSLRNLQFHSDPADLDPF
jgi:hypothetical protein